MSLVNPLLSTGARISQVNKVQLSTPIKHLRMLKIHNRSKKASYTLGLQKETRFRMSRTFVPSRQQPDLRQHIFQRHPKCTANLREADTERSCYHECEEDWVKC